MKWITPVMIIVVAAFVSCSKIQPSDTPSPAVEKMFRPYEVSFVQEVMLNEGLLPQGAILTPTHRYVSLKATTENALLSLKNSGLPITPFSLATGERAGNGTFYTLLPANVSLNAEVTVHTLAELYIPEPGNSSLEKLLLQKSGYLDDAVPLPSSLTAGTIIKGKITLEYPENSSYRPLRNVSLVAVENSKIVAGQTDGSGSFSFTGNFFKKLDIYAVFDNDIVQISRLPKRNMLETFFPAWQKLGTFRSDTWGNIDIAIPFSQPEPWSLGTLNNSIFEYYDFCEAYGYKKPDKKLVMWADENYLFSTSYATPMLNHLAINDRRYIADILKNMLGIPYSVAMPLSNLSNVGLPDIYTHYFTSSPSKRLRRVMFHEMTHAAHYMQIGDAFWVKYISYIVKNGGYGTENSPGNGIVAYAEGWADDLSYECYNHTFGSYLEVNPEVVPVEWIIYGLYYDLADDNVETEDHVSGIRFKQVYDLFTPEVDNSVVLKEKIKANLSGPTATTTDIDALFHRHGY